eukprot:767770-Hanusia_phi.AAC.3
MLDEHTGAALARRMEAAVNAEKDQKMGFDTWMSQLKLVTVEELVRWSEQGAVPGVGRSYGSCRSSRRQEKLSSIALTR